MQIKHLTVAAALSITMASALADDWYGTVSIGQSRIEDGKKSDIDSVLTSNGITGLSSKLDRKDTAYKLQLGYRFNPNWAMEGGYVDLGKFDYKAAFAGGTASGQTKASGFNIAGVGTLPLDNDFSLFAKLGLIDAKVEDHLSASGPGLAGSASADATKWKGNFGAGLAYNMNRDVSLRAELERFDNLGDKNRTGESNVNLFSVGAVFNF